MSAPQTNITRQKRRHAGPLIGIVIAALLAVGFLFFYMTYSAQTVPTPDLGVPLIDGGVTPPLATN